MVREGRRGVRGVSKGLVTAVIYLRSGQTLRFQAEKVVTSRSKLTGELLEIRWEGDAEPSPLYLDLSQVAAVTTEKS